jgi:hypothetical protein
MVCDTMNIFGQDRKFVESLLQKCLDSLDDFSLKHAALNLISTYKPELLRQPLEPVTPPSNLTKIDKP